MHINDIWLDKEMGIPFINSVLIRNVTMHSHGKHTHAVYTAPPFGCICCENATVAAATAVDRLGVHIYISEYM